ncbi:hypothetical protein ACP4OV_005375 [Aristida adscensionis]
MEVTAVSVGKFVLSGALGYPKSALAEEVALQHGVQRDHAFICDELEMMQAFLKAAHDEPDKQEVFMAWVKQVCDVAYDAEDNLQECSMKELRARVEDVSQRNLRCQLFKNTSPKFGAGAGQSSSFARSEMSGTEEALRQQYKAKMNLIGMINKKDSNLKVIALGRTSGSFEEEEMSIVKRAYDDLKRNKKFECHAWIRIMHPFNPTEFLQTIVRQLFVDSLEEAAKKEHNSVPQAQDLRRMAMMKEDHLVDAFKKYLNENKDSQDETYSTKPESSSNTDTIIDNNNTVDGGRLTRTDTMVAAFKESQLIGRIREKAEIIQLISNSGGSREFEVISIYGMGGLGKTTLVKSVYQSQELSAKFDKCACITVKRPFDPKELLSSLAMQLDGKQKGSSDISKLEDESPLAGCLAEKKYCKALFKERWKHIQAQITGQQRSA